MLGLGWVNHLQVQKISRKNPLFWFFSPLGQNISSSQVKKYPGQSCSGSLFTADQKYAQVRSGLISSVFEAS